MRTIIDLTDEQLRGLTELCRKEHISRAEAIRRAVARLLEERAAARETRRDALNASFGLWKDRAADTDAYLAGVRSEWER
ncbi:MAG TPA: ribbon-helix-helix protein, CopG family [Tepidiformaceae bacterium]